MRQASPLGSRNPERRRGLSPGGRWARSLRGGSAHTQERELMAASLLSTGQPGSLMPRVPGFKDSLCFQNMRPKQRDDQRKQFLGNKGDTASRRKLRTRQNSPPWGKISRELGDLDQEADSGRGTNSVGEGTGRACGGISRSPERKMSGGEREIGMANAKVQKAEREEGTQEMAQERWTTAEGFWIEGSQV